MIWENIKMAFRSIAGNKLRTALTMLGLIIGIASVVVISAVGEGVKKSVTNQVDELGTNLIQVNPGSGDFTNFASSLGASTLTEADVTSIKKIQGVEAVAPSMIVSGVGTKDKKQVKGGFLIATTPDYAKAVKTDLEFGSFLKNDNQKQVVVGYKAVQDLFGEPKASVIGQSIKIRDESFEIIGITKKPKEGGLPLGPSLDSIIYMPFQSGKQFNNNNANINEIEVKAANADEVAKVKDKVKKAVKKNHGGQTDFSVADAKEQLKVFEKILSLLTAFVGAIASIALLVGGIGIMNIMLVSVTERTHEIGLRKAIGASSRTILGQFLIEAIIVCLIGGMLGLALAYGGALLVGKLAGIDPILTQSAMIYAVTASIAVGIIFGIAPAIKAARKKPIEALRYE